MYLYEADVTLLLDRLNSDPEIAVLDHNWIAVPDVKDVRDGSYMLWHVPSGPLPLTNPVALHPGVIQLDLHRWGTVCNSQGEKRFPFDRSPDVIGMSCFGWIGNRYRPIGLPASPATEKWWNRLRRWVAKMAIRIPRWGPIESTDPEIYAFPCAYKAIKSGKARDDNPL